MATHTTIGGGGGFRYFQINREHGETDGEPYFFESLRNPPSPDLLLNKFRRFESRNNKDKTKKYEYELFKAISGILTEVKIVARTIEGEEQEELVLIMTDDGDAYYINCGSIEKRYAADIMKRLLDPNFDPALTLRLSPYAILNKESGKWNIGLAAMSGDAKLSAAKEANPALLGLPNAEEIQRGKKKSDWNWFPVYSWLWSETQRVVLPKLQTSPQIQIEFDNPVRREREKEIGTSATESYDLPF